MTHAETCFYCGETASLEVFEVWTDSRTFQLTGCCNGNVEDWERELVEAFEATDDDALEMRRSFRTWFQNQTGIAIRGVALGDQGGLRYGNGGVSLDYGLELGEVTCKEAKAFVVEHHRHNRPPVSWRWGHAIRNGGELIAVAMVGRPVARALDPTKIVEVNRLCVNPDVPRAIVLHACSKLYAAAAREAKKRGFEKAITYTLETELGTTLKAAGWIPEAKTKGGSWDTPSRRRSNKTPTCRKVRWARRLKKEVQR